MMRGNWSTFARMIATLGPVGFLPAPGTAATICTAIALWGLSWVVNPTFWVMWIVLIVACAMMITHVALSFFDEPDPACIVIDEVAGFTYAMCLFPHTWWWLCIGVVVFRFFDIFKPLGIAYVERLGGVPGVVFDDILAGFYTQIVLLAGCLAYAVWFA